MRRIYSIFLFRYFPFAVRAIIIIIAIGSEMCFSLLSLKSILISRDETRASSFRRKGTKIPQTKPTEAHGSNFHPLHSNPRYNEPNFSCYNNISGQQKFNTSSDKN